MSELPLTVAVELGGAGVVSGVVVWIEMMEVLEMEMCERVSEEMEMTSASRGGGMVGGAFSFLIARVFIDFGGGIFLAGRTRGCIWVSAPDEDEDEDLSGAFCDC